MARGGSAYAELIDPKHRLIGVAVANGQILDRPEARLLVHREQLRRVHLADQAVSPVQVR